MPHDILVLQVSDVLESLLEDRDLLVAQLYYFNSHQSPFYFVVAFLDHPMNPLSDFLAHLILLFKSTLSPQRRVLILFIGSVRTWTCAAGDWGVEAINFGNLLTFPSFPLFVHFGLYFGGIAGEDGHSFHP